MKQITTISGPMIAKGMRRIDGEQRDRRQDEHDGDDVAEIHGGDQAPDEVRPLDEEHGPGIQTPDHQPAHHHGRGGRTRDAERQHRQHGAGARRVVRGLGRDDALRLALSRSGRGGARSAWRGHSS